MSEVIFKNIGLQDYSETWQAMKELTSNRIQDSNDEIWFVQHSPVYTLGLNGKKKHLIKPNQIPVINIDRGGQVTYHGPGQLVIYCMVNLKKCGYGVQAFVSRLQQSTQNLLSNYDIDSHLVEKAPGVYVDSKKIAAIGLRVKRDCTYHGLSLNINMNLAPFKDINPCGYTNLEVTQLSNLGINDNIEQVIKKFEPILKRTIYD